MRIISSFHDYYDSAQAEGQDLSRVFVRNPELFQNFDEKRLPDPLKPLWARTLGEFNCCSPKGNASIEPFLIAFAGKLHPGAHLRRQPSGSARAFDDVFAYELQTVLEFAEASGFNLKRRSYRSGLTLQQRLVRFFSIKEDNAFSAHLSAHRLAIVYARQKSGANCMVVNASLKEHQFFKALDAWQAYQELAMFQGNLAAPENQSMTPISDDDRLKQHGFDQWSFRKLPQPTKR